MFKSPHKIEFNYKRSYKTGRCLKECKPEQERNSDTGRCRLKCNGKKSLTSNLFNKKHNSLKLLNTSDENSDSD